MEPALWLSLEDTFLQTGSRRNREISELARRSNSDHIAYLLGDREALIQKVVRAEYVSMMVGASSKDIMDYGCGCGFLACALAKSGATQIIGIEIDDPRREVANYLAKEVFMCTNVNFYKTLGDAPPGQFDVILLINVISHLHKVFESIATLRERLIPNGLLMIEDNNNLQSPFVRRHLRRREWAGGKHSGEKIYRQMRRHFITMNFSELNYRQIETLTDATYGLTYGEIDTFIKATLREGTVPFDSGFLTRRAPIDPAQQQFHENAFSPKEIDTILFNLGFVPSLRKAKHIFDYRKHRIVSALFGYFPRISLSVSPAYEILAIRKC